MFDSWLFYVIYGRADKLSYLTFALNNFSLFTASHSVTMAAFGVSNLRKFKVLTWKTLKIKARHYVETTLNLVVPTLLFIVVVVLRYELGDFKPTHEPASTYPAKNDLGAVCDLLNYAGPRFLYTPKTAGVNETMKRFLHHLEFFQTREKFNCADVKISLEALDDEDEIVRTFKLQQNEGDDNATMARIGQVSH